jgi:NADH:ubiquinone oxidoreductase subunit 4 (subunit M)
LLTVVIVGVGVYPQLVMDIVGPSLDKIMEIVQVSNSVVK